LTKVLHGHPVAIDAGDYRVKLYMLPRRERGKAVVRMDVAVRLAWGTGFHIDFALHEYEEAQELRKALRALRVHTFREWLSMNGYDAQGNMRRDDATFGVLSGAYRRR